MTAVALKTLPTYLKMKIYEGANIWKAERSCGFRYYSDCSACDMQICVGFRYEVMVNYILFSYIFIILILFFKRMITSYVASVDYFAVFWLGVLFHTNGVDARGAHTDNLWIIWNINYISVIIVEIIWFIAIKRKSSIHLIQCVMGGER